MVAPLNPEDLTIRISRLNGWEGDGSEIRRTYQAPSFPAAIELVTAAARIAEEMNHHPDIDIRYRKVTFAVCTHSAGAVTELDTDLAARVDAAAAALGAT
jgi:4a-hydroxytetrahydrobiopterin dehydratase